jgi:hypothetical protein
MEAASPKRIAEKLGTLHARDIVTSFGKQARLYGLALGDTLPR